MKRVCSNALQMIAVALAINGTALPALAQPPSAAPAQPTSAPPPKPFSEQIVGKADKILAEAGLRRSGKTITTSAASDIARGISGLTRSRRSLKLLHDVWRQTSDQLAQQKQRAEALNAQNFQLNSQLARPGLDATSNNRLVGMINANIANMRQISADEERMKVKLAADRKSLNDAEATYAEAVLALRREFNAVKASLDETLAGEQVKIALHVFGANFETPADVTSDTLLVAIDKRLKQIEQEVFSESIPLDVTANGSLYVNVTVGDRTTRMVLDSGASVISLPSNIAAELGVIVPSDARQIRLVLADGREIPGRAVTLPKVRIGQFEAENVNAAVLDSIAVNAEPLLGMSFLGNFKFEIDTADKSLKLLRVSAE